jgi:flagellar hook-associated protein 2
MSDLVIPGVTSQVNTQKMIDAIMEVERQPLKRLEQDAALQKSRKNAWLGINRSLGTLRDSARQLFGLQTPFNEKIADSSNAKVLTAAATRQAVDETRAITVEKIATADRFLSRSLARDFTVPAGDYGFAIGGKEVRFSFKGGSLAEFVDALNRRGGDLVRASVINDTPTTRVLLIEGKLTGAANRLAFLDKAAELGAATGMLERTRSATRQLSLTQQGIVRWTKALDPSQYRLSDGTLTLQPGSELKLPVQPPVALNEHMVLELSVNVERLPETAEQPNAPPGPSIPPTGSVQMGGVTIQAAPSQAPAPELPPPKAPERIDDLHVLFMESGAGVIELPPLSDTTGFTKISVDLGGLADHIDSLDLRNRSTFRRISIRDVAIVDSTQRGDYVAAHPLSQAADAELSVDGVPATRPANRVDDLIPGVTLNLLAPGAEPVTLAVHRNAELIKKQILELVGAYNRSITDIDILTRKDEQVIEDAQYLTEDERKTARDNLGILSAETTLTRLKGSMQQIMMNAYPTSRGRELALLAQAGIATDLRPPGSGIDKTKLRGYLEIDEAKLDLAIASAPDALRELFGNDTDGDLVVNAGLAWTMDTLLRPYVQSGGILPSRASGIDAQITRTNKQITDLQHDLDDKQAELKRKYGQMESALNAMEQSSQALQNFGRATGANSGSGQQ